MRIISILLFFISISFLSCSHVNTDSKAEKFIGKWESIKRVIPYKATLTIKPDSSFIFKFGACQMIGGCEGRWKIENDNIILNSIELDSCLYAERFGINCMKIPVDTTNQIERLTTKSGCIPQSDYLYVIFMDNKFVLKSDSLIHESIIDTICPEIKDIFIKNNK